MEEFIAFIAIFAIAIFLGALVHVPWFRWLVIIGVCIFAYIKWINPKVQAKISTARTQEEATRHQKEQEEINAIKSKTAEKITDNQGYELNILPFLNYLYHSSHKPSEILNVINKCEENARVLSETAKEINATASKYNMWQRLQVHSK